MESGVHLDDRKFDRGFRNSKETLLRSVRKSRDAKPLLSAAFAYYRLHMSYFKALW